MALRSSLPLLAALAALTACITKASFQDEDRDGHPFPEDCDDGDPTVYPGATELKNGVDDDCDADGAIDEPWDQDQDGHESLAYDGGDDCDDEDSGVHPGADELCGDCVDNDCDGGVGHCAWPGESPLSVAAEYADLAYASSAGATRLGAALWGGGDLSGDGIPDLVVGEPGASGEDGTRGVGAVWVVSDLAAPALSSIAEVGVAWRGTETGEQVGAALTSFLTEDALGGLLVGGPGTGTSAGGAYVIFGPISSGGIAGADGEALGDDTGDGAQAGSAVAAVDLEGDGLDVLAVGAPGADEIRLYAVSGASSVAASAFIALEGPVGGRFGAALAPAGDLDGDGLGDLLVGEPDAESGDGRVWAIHGGVYDEDAALTDDAAPHATGQWGEALGAAIAAGRDLDGDGYADVLAGGPEAWSPAGHQTGAARLWLGPIPQWGAAGGALDWVGDAGSADAVLVGERGGDGAGASVAFVGDVNGDGFEDLAVGSDQGLPSDLSRAWVVLGPVSGSLDLSTAALRLTDASSGAYVVAPAPAEGGDGADSACNPYASILVGAPSRDVGAGGQGAVFFVAGIGM